MLKGIRKGAKLFVVDPRRTSSAQWADRWLGLDVGSDIILAHAVGREILAAGLENRRFIEHSTSGFDEYRDYVQQFTLERAERETGVPAAAIRELAHAYAKAPTAQLCWTLGITEHHNAVDNVLALINLSLLTGQVGRYGSGLVPLRGQNNVQGGGDLGALPDRLAGFQHVENDELSNVIPTDVFVNAFEQQCFAYFVERTKYDVRFDIEGYAGHADTYLTAKTEPSGPGSETIGG